MFVQKCMHIDATDARKKLKNASQDADSFGTNICVCYNSLNSLTLPPQPPSIPPCHIYKRKGNL